MQRVLVDDVEEVDQVEDARQGGHDGQGTGRLDDAAMKQLVAEVGVVPREAAHAYDYVICYELALTKTIRSFFTKEAFSLIK